MHPQRRSWQAGREPPSRVPVRQEMQACAFHLATQRHGDGSIVDRRLERRGRRRRQAGTGQPSWPV